MKLLLQQSSIQLAGEPPTNANATPSREGEKSLNFLSDKHDELILFKTNAMAELGRLGKKIEAVNEKVKNISEAIESMENYSYQYNIKLLDSLNSTNMNRRMTPRNYASKSLKPSVQVN